MTAHVVLLGQGIGYSASPAIHDAAFRELGLAVDYSLRDVRAEELGAAVNELRGEGYLGANVTAPHKLAVCALADQLASEVRRLGAANTLVRQDGHLLAHNTDLAALRAELAELAPRPTGPAVVLGTGGASAAVQAALADLGWDDLRVLRREQWRDLRAVLRHAGLVVNATPIGTASEESPVPDQWLRGDLLVLDLVYRPSPTRLVRVARAAGAAARGGAGVLLRQAAASFTLWTGLPAPIEPMRRALRVELGAFADA